MPYGPSFAARRIGRYLDARRAGCTSVQSTVIGRETRALQVENVAGLSLAVRRLHMFGEPVPLRGHQRRSRGGS